jgi:hypothetical protein
MLVNVIGWIRTRLPVCLMLVSFLAYSSTLKMEVTYFSKISVDFQRTTRRYIPEDIFINLILAIPVRDHERP